jgi:hypothetical protein
MKAIIKIFIVMLFATLACPASADLGGEPEKFAHASATTVTQQPGYSVRTTTLSTGTEVHEYVSDQGIVFAVSWQGPFKPNLRKLLGRHFGKIANHEGRKAKSSRSQKELKDSEVVIRTSGHMRAYEGQAWLPSQFPAGFSEENIT